MDLILYGILNKRIKQVEQNGGSALIVDGSLSISGQAADAKVVGDRLAELVQQLSKKVSAEDGKGLSTNDFTDELLQKLVGLPLSPGDNIVKVIQINGTEIAISEDGVVDIPVASEDKLGVVKSTSVENGVCVAMDGTMQVNSISFSKIVQDMDDLLVLENGDSSW